MGLYTRCLPRLESISVAHTSVILLHVQHAVVEHMPTANNSQCSMLQSPSSVMWSGRVLQQSEQKQDELESCCLSQQTLALQTAHQAGAFAAQLDSGA